MKRAYKIVIQPALFQRAAQWLSLAVLAIATVLPSAATAAGQITSRSTLMDSSAASASTGYTFTWTGATAGTIKAVKFQMCTSPLEQTTCTAPTGGSLASATVSSVGGLTSFAISGTQNATQVIISNATGVAGNATFNPKFISITNPNTANTSFYTRITTYSDTSATTEVDYGAEAVSTANQITTTANVQESLTFCVGTSGTGCSGGGLTGTSVNLGVGTDNVLSTSSPSGGTSLMAADTNATSGYAITYLANNLSSTNDTITAAGGTAGTFTAGTAKFGINLKANTTPAIGAAISGSGSGAVGAQYDIANNFAFVPAAATTVATASGPTLSNLYTVSYAAQAGSTTKPGSYSTTFTWVCTGTF